MAETKAGDSVLFESLAVPVVMGPLFKQIEEKDPAAAQQLRTAFNKVELQHPGFAFDFMRAILQRAEMYDKLNLNEAFLKLEGQNEYEEYRIERPEAAFEDLNGKAKALKKILSRIPDEIDDRRRFLETIKEIANAIKNLLDAVNGATPLIRTQLGRAGLDRQKREFVKYSKQFSNTLKAFFKDNQKAEVFLAANHLINETNMIMRILKEATSG